MKKIILLCAVLMVPLMITAQSKGITGIQNNPGSESKNIHAIIVGISNYKNIQKLQYAHTDAYAFYKFLISPAGGNIDSNNVILLLNEKATAGRIYAALEEMLEMVHEGDQIIFYFSGHGDLETKTVRQNGFLLAYDAPVAAYMTGGTIGINYLQDYLLTFADKKCKVLLVTDACRSGKLAGGVEGAQLTAKALQEQWQNITKILSSQGGELSYEDKKWGGNGGGVFTHYLLRGMKGLADMNNDKKVTSAELLVYLLQNIPRETKFVQNPSVNGDMNAVISHVDSVTLLALLNEQGTETGTSSQLAFKGFEDKILEKLDSSVVREYQSFQLSISRNLLIDSAENQESAWAIYERLKDNKDAAAIISNVKRTLLAALQDKAQIVINNYLAGMDIPDSIDLNKAYYEMEYAYNMIDESYIMYKNIKSRYLLLKACLYETDNQKILSILNEVITLEPDAAFAYFLMGGSYSNLKQYDMSKKYYRKTLELTPRWAYAWNNLGTIYTAEGKHDSAIIFYNKAIGFKVDMPEPYYNLGLSYYNKTEYEKAINFHQQALVLKPKYSSAYSSMGWCYYDQELYEKALEMFNRALEFKPDDKDYKTNAALCYIKMNEPDVAIKMLQEVVKYNDGFARALYNLGFAYETKKVFDKAIYYYKRSAQIDTSYCTGYSKIAAIYLYELEDYTNAEDYYKKYLQFRPSYTSTYVNLGNLYYNQDKYNEALSYYQKAYELDTLYAQAYLYAGQCFSSMDRLDEAMPLYEKAMKSDPKYAATYIELGRVYRLQGKYEEAKEYYLRALQVDSTAYKALYKIADMYQYDLKDYVIAADYFNRYVALNPNNSDAYLELGNCYYYESKYDEALDSYYKALEIDTNYKGTYLDIANVYYDMKDYPKSEKYYLKAISKDSCYGLGYSNIGDLYYDMGQYKDAISSYENAMRCDNKYEYRTYTIGMLYANELKDYEKAKLYYERYITYAPDRYLGYQGLGYVYLKTGKNKKAEQYFITSIQKEPEEPWVYYNMACFYSLGNDHVNSLDYLEKALQKGFDNFDHIGTDTDMDNIRNLQGFKFLIEKYSKQK
ncbi:MAG: tetratricopeptide repeat protein [Bacteroidales bacterium]|nr:tetratricopeptide repeat protein [Bacteroidales bacterium]MDD4215221.1 tetratricopeptide repeat protein [Bacteroidales bacterium]